MFLIKYSSIYQGIAGDVTKLAMKTGNAEKMFSLEVSVFSLYILSCLSMD